MADATPSTGPGAWLSDRRTGTLAIGVLTAAYCLFVLIPIATRLARGQYFGWDVGEYLLTARLDLTGGANPFRYPFPVLPTAYLPLVAGGAGLTTLYSIADWAGGGLLIVLFLVAGYLGYSIEGSKVAAGACAVSVGTYSLLLGEIGLGSQAQLAAFVFGLSAIAVTVRGRPIRTGIPAPWVAGLLLFLAALSETYSAAFFVLATVFYLAAHEGRRLLRFAMLRTHWPVVGLPAAGLLVVVATGGYASATAANLPILPYLLSPGGWARAVTEVGFGNPLNAYGYLLVAVVLVVLVLFGRPLARRAAALLVGVVGAGAVQILLLTPSVYWNRAEYFVVFPLAVAVATMAPGWPRSLARRASPAPESNLRRWSLSAPRRTRVEQVASMIVIGVVVAQSAVATELYPRALAYYSIDPSSLSTLTWLRGEPGAALVVAPSGWTFGIANAIGRPVFPFSQPVWYDTPAQQQRAVLATLIASGRQWISDGSLSVVDTGSPTNATSPAIFASQFPYLLKLLDVGEGPGILSDAPAVRHPAAVVPGGGVRPAAGTFVDRDAIPNYTVTKTTTVRSDGTVLVNLTYTSTTMVAQSSTVGVQLPQAALSSASVSGVNASLVESFQFAGNPRVAVPVSISINTPTSGVGIAPPDELSVGAVPTFSWTLTPGGGFVGSSFNLTIAVTVGGQALGVPALENATTEMAQHGIDWLVLCPTCEPGAAVRFENDPTFALRSDAAGFAVYSVD